MPFCVILFLPSSRSWGRCLRILSPPVDSGRYLGFLGHLGNRTIVNTGPATGAQIRYDGAGALFDLDLEITRFAFDRFQIGIGDQFDIQMPADLDQYG